MAGNRKCILCGKEYYYCPTCPGDSHLPKFMLTFHDQNCHDVFNAVNDEFFGDITALEAKKILSGLDLSGQDSYSKSVRDAIKRIMATEDPRKEEKKAEPTNHNYNKGFSKNKK